MAVQEASFNSQSRSKCPLVSTVLPHLLGAAALVFLIIAVSVIDWSHGTLQDIHLSEAGNYEIGLWKACSDIPNVFYSLGKCQNGHCNRYTSLIKKRTIDEVVWGAHDLCDKAAATQAFVLLGIFFALVGCYMSSVKAAFGWDCMWGKAAFFNLCTAFCSMLAWAIWLDWVRQMNDDNPEGTRIQFKDMSVGTGFNCAVIAFLVSFINIWICRYRYILHEQYLTRKRENKDRLAQNGENPYDEHSDKYLEVHNPNATVSPV